MVYLYVLLVVLVYFRDIMLGKHWRHLRIFIDFGNVGTFTTVYMYVYTLGLLLFLGVGYEFYAMVTRRT